VKSISAMKSLLLITLAVPLNMTSKLFNNFNELSEYSTESGPFAPSLACEGMMLCALYERAPRGTLSYYIDKNTTFSNYTRNE
jgi:hypothetical protein